ncbi:transposase [Cohnella algarum]|uniref:transposase n=1 Tax=Cohnella algarum TaxID=2044859 RepID=UPI00196792D5|nr:transposase [Cohnella algarum]MBN2981197.1 transposase [Cohnella algarum]
MASESLLNQDPVIYHYKLIRKIPLRPEARYSYITTAVMGIGAITAIYRWQGLLNTLIGFLIMTAIHAVVLRLTLRRVDEPSMKRWAFRYDWPWFGPLPVMDTTLWLFRRLHFHLFIVGCCIVGLLYPWAHSSLLVSLVYWHFWLLTPRVTLLFNMIGEKGDGVLRLSSDEVSYYHR